MVLSVANDCDRWFAIFISNYGFGFVNSHVKSFIFTAQRSRFLQPKDQALENIKSKNASQINLGNYWMDMIRPLFRFFIPLGLVFSLLLTFQGVPSTLSAGPTAQVLDRSTEVQTQHIPLGPVAPMVAIKQLGSNGGGWYGPNSSVPLENPTLLSKGLRKLKRIVTE